MTFEQLPRLGKSLPALLRAKEGGSLILGAERDRGGWQLPGYSFPGGEAGTWLSNAIRELTPRSASAFR